MDPHRRAWNAHQHLLQNALLHPEKHPEWLSLFLSQQAQVHSQKLSSSEKWSFQDEVLIELDEIDLRAIPPKCDHSVAWILWHIARCEDLTMNMLVAGIDPVFERQGWKMKLHAPFVHTGNEISLREVIRFSKAVDLASLIEYRLAVGKSTQEVVSRLTPNELEQKVKPDRMDKVRALEVVLDPSVLNYWSRRTTAGLLLMPPTRHCFTHLNEASRLKLALHAR